MKKIVIISVIVIAIIAGSLYLTRDTSSPTTTDKTQQSSTDSQNTNNSEESTAQLETFTSSQVETHKTEQDCWTIINGSVYDITSYVPRHPGGDEILKACGVDGTSLFETRTTSDGQEVGSGTPHSSSAASQLESLKIGTLSN